MLYLDRAKAPAIERSKTTPYNIGLFSIDSIPGLWRSRNVAFVYVRFLSFVEVTQPCFTGVTNFENFEDDFVRRKI